MSQMYYYHLESRWRNSHILVYHGPLQIATFWEWLAIYFSPLGYGTQRVSSLLPITTQDKLESVSSSLRSLPRKMIHQPIGSKCFNMCWFGSQIFLIGEIFPNSASTHIGRRSLNFEIFFLDSPDSHSQKKSIPSCQMQRKTLKRWRQKKHMTFNHPSSLKRMWRLTIPSILPYWKF